MGADGWTPPVFNDNDLRWERDDVQRVLRELASLGFT